MDFKEVIQQIKNEYDIVDYIRMNGVDLESSGVGSWKGLCPFHNENTPSFIVSEDFQNYKCFGCGESGDILSFAQHTHTISFYEAVKLLAEEKGIEIQESVSNEPTHDIMGIREVVSDAEEFFRANFDKLNNSHPAKQEIISRGLSVDNEIYGYSLEAPNELYKYLRDKGHSDKNIEDSNLVIFYDEPGRNPWDFFHGRLMITLSDYLGRPISFTSRKIFEDDRMKGKYVNGKDSPVFHKKNNLFGADMAKAEARKNKEVYVVEGQFDQIAMYENDVKNVVATSGTAFTEEHANLLLRMIGDSGRVVFIMDGDSAGVDAAISVFKTAKELHSRSHAVHLSDGKDPCDYIEEGGIEKLIDATKSSVPLYDFIVDAIIKDLGGTIDVNNRQRFVSEVASYAKMTDESYIVESMLGKASVLSAISIDNVEDMYNEAKEVKRYNRKKPNKEVKKLDPIVKLDKGNEADICMFSAMALLVRAPYELMPKTPDKIHNKFKPFMKELKSNYEIAKREDKKWRFIAEDYEDSDLALSLQNKRFLEDPKEDMEAMTSQYEYLFNRANEIYNNQYEEMKRARALSSIIDSTDAKEIADALRLYSNS